MYTSVFVKAYLLFLNADKSNWYLSMKNNCLYKICATITQHWWYLESSIIMEMNKTEILHKALSKCNIFIFGLHSYHMLYYNLWMHILCSSCTKFIERGVVCVRKLSQEVLHVVLFLSSLNSFSKKVEGVELRKLRNGAHFNANTHIY